MKTINLYQSLKLSVAMLCVAAIILPLFASAGSASSASALSQVASLYPGATITKQIWVSPTGDNRASGSESSPLRDIQAAVEKATPGTAILVKAGTYTEQVAVNDFDTTPSATSPIVLVSVDGLQRAIIKAPDADNEALQIYNSSYIGVYGFEFVGSAKDSVSNGTVVEVDGIRGTGTHASADGHIVFVDNYIHTSGTGIDGFRAEYVHDLTLINNIISGNYRGQSIDLSTVWDSTIEKNTVSGAARQGLVIDDGSQDVSITGNKFTVSGTPAVQIGGDSVDTTTVFPASFLGFAAKNIDFSANTIQNTSGDGLWLSGAVNTDVVGNYIEATGVKIYYRQASRETTAGIAKLDSADNTITGNVYNDTGIFATSFSYTGSSQIVGNTTSANNSGTIATLGLAVGSSMTVSTPAVSVEASELRVNDIVIALANINVRQAPGLSTTVIMVAPIDSSARIMGDAQVVDGITWYDVEFSVSGTRGWVSSEYMKSAASTINHTVTSFSGTPIADVLFVMVELDNQAKTANVIVVTRSGDRLQKSFGTAVKTSLLSSVAAELGTSVSVIEDMVSYQNITPDTLLSLKVDTSTYGGGSYRPMPSVAYSTTIFPSSSSSSEPPAPYHYWKALAKFHSGNNIFYENGTQFEIDLVDAGFAGDWQDYNEWLDDYIMALYSNAYGDYFGNGHPLRARDAFGYTAASMLFVSFEEVMSKTTYNFSGYSSGSSFSGSSSFGGSSGSTASTPPAAGPLTYSIQYRVITCTQASTDSSYGRFINDPSVQAKAIPNGWLHKRMGEIIAVAGDGWANWPMISGGTLRGYGFALESRSIGTDASGAQAYVSSWSTARTGNCDMPDPTVYTAS